MNEQTGSRRDDVDPSDQQELVDAGELDGAPDALEPREEQELRAQLARELRLDGFEQGLQG